MSQARAVTSVNLCYTWPTGKYHMTFDLFCFFLAKMWFWWSISIFGRILVIGYSSYQIITVLNRNITVLNCENSYRTGTTLAVTAVGFVFTYFHTWQTSSWSMKERMEIWYSKVNAIKSISGTSMFLAAEVGISTSFCLEPGNSLNIFRPMFYEAMNDI